MNEPITKRLSLPLNLLPLLNSLPKSLFPPINIRSHDHSPLIINPSFHIPILNQSNDERLGVIFIPAESGGHASEGDGGEGGEVGEESSGFDLREKVRDVGGEVEI